MTMATINSIRTLYLMYKNVKVERSFISGYSIRHICETQIWVTCMKQFFQLKKKRLLFNGKVQKDVQRNHTAFLGNKYSIQRDHIGLGAATGTGTGARIGKRTGTGTGTGTFTGTGTGKGPVRGQGQELGPVLEQGPHRNFFK
jgi:hypothetical protein